MSAISRPMRKIIEIDQEKCDGCGICAEACHEGAIEIISGKARLVKEAYCDGLGDCIGPCPRDAIAVVERPAEPYDEKAVMSHLSEVNHSHSCPGSAPREIERASAKAISRVTEDWKSDLTNWPVQMRLVPVGAPFLENSNLLIAADCVPFSLAGFHSRFVRGRVVLMGCPKLDDSNYYLEKLEEIFRIHRILSVTVPYMEVPCCGALPRLVKEAAFRSGKDIHMEFIRIGIDGDPK